jgi:hypothetical protein
LLAKFAVAAQWKKYKQSSDRLPYELYKLFNIDNSPDRVSTFDPGFASPQHQSVKLTDRLNPTRIDGQHLSSQLSPVLVRQQSSQRNR